MRKITPESEIFTRTVQDIVTREELKKLLASGRRIRIKHGLDATSPDLHIGHAASLWKIRSLQEAGHKAVILLGDVTTAIGDPTGRSKARPALPAAQIRKNCASLERQIKKILLTGRGVLEIRKSSEWYEKINVPEFLRLLSFVTHARLIEREMFQRRIGSGQEIFAHELIYPILQGHDSAVLKDDLTIIGSDQLFNEHFGRFFQEKCGQRPQVIVSLKILPGLDGGEKMSKSLGNYIGLDDSPQDKFGKAMRLLDPLIVSYLEAYTDVSLGEIKKIDEKLKAGLNPMEAKLFFAEQLVRRYHGEKMAGQERKRFLALFSQKEYQDAPAVEISQGEYGALDLILRTGLAKSKSDARRLIGQGAVEIGGKTILIPTEKVWVEEGTVVKVGKRRIARII